MSTTNISFVENGTPGYQESAYWVFTQDISSSYPFTMSTFVSDASLDTNNRNYNITFNGYEGDNINPFEFIAASIPPDFQSFATIPVEIEYDRGGFNPNPTLSSNTVELSSNFLPQNSTDIPAYLSMVYTYEFSYTITSFSVQIIYGWIRGQSGKVNYTVTKNSVTNPTSWTVYSTSNPDNVYTASLVQNNDSKYIFEIVNSTDGILNYIAPAVLGGSDILHTVNNYGVNNDGVFDPYPIVEGNSNKTVPTMASAWIWYYFSSAWSYYSTD